MTDRNSVPEWAEVTEASPFTPPASSARPTLLIAVAMVALGLAGFWGYKFWLPGDSGNKPVPASAPVVAREAPAAPAPALRAHMQERMRQEAQRQRPEPAKTWTRCQVGDQVVYSDAGCGAGVAQRSSADTQAPVSAIPSMPETAASHTLYRCKPYSGGAFWSTRHCNQREALVDRMVTVPRNLTLNQKIALAERSLKNVPASVNRSTSPAPQRSVARSGKQVECNALDAKILQIDARARQPISASEQDWLRAERQKAHTRRFFLHC